MLLDAGADPTTQDNKGNTAADYLENDKRRWLNRHEREATWDEQDAPEGRWRSYSYE